MSPSIRIAAFSLAALLLASCGGGGGGNAQTAQLPAAVTPALGFAQVKTLRFSWSDVAGATHYRLLEDPDGSSGFQPVSGDIASGEQQYDHIVPLHRRINARYIVQSCNSAGCTDSDTLFVDSALAQAIGYVKAANTGSWDLFGYAVALSGDGDTLAVAARDESSSATGLNGDQASDNAGDSGAVYVFTRNAGQWSQQAYVKASNTGASDQFGWSLALSADGDTLAVGASLEDGTESGLHALDYLNGALDSGAAYVFTRESGAWSQQAYVKASNTEPSDRFGRSLALSADGDSLVVVAPGEDSSATGLGGDQTDDSAEAAGAVYLY